MSRSEPKPHIEAILIGEKLLQKIQYKPGMTMVFRAIEPLRADEAGDGMDLPQYNINIGGAQSLRGAGRAARPAPEDREEMRG